ncbi:LACH-like protein [Mya arenaria]|uniref:LACH-like protein n=1 Tax=Mya arenaria TaxID=6604 RepID=A0ABY7E0Z0_MYAAR|nr:lachesin-like [Mya arenaria]WAR00821.1 LACH-like protein [Mya arenaria]
MRERESALWTAGMRMLGRVLLAWLLEWRVLAAEPSFRVPPENVTVVAGGLAVLPCSIIHLTAEHKVVWTDAEGFLLSLNEKRVYEDTRFSVERPFKKYWNLHIRDTRPADAGKYVCQISTDPVKVKEVMLYVQVPAKIIDMYSSDAVTAMEGETVTLTCNASGEPAPEITWFRAYNSATKSKERIGSDGEMLKIYNVSRDCGGTYVCIADNGVGDEAVREMEITVNYAPEVYLKTTRMGQSRGKETILECDVMAHPHGVMIWERDGKDLAADTSGKYQVEIFETNYHLYKKTLSLRIRDIQDADFGRYTCSAENFIARDSESMILYDYSLTLNRLTSTTRRPDVLIPSRNLHTTLRPKAWNKDTSEDNNTDQKRNKGFSRKTVLINPGAIRGRNAGYQNSADWGPVLYAALTCLHALVMASRTAS